MLPFLQPKKAASVIIAKRAKTGEEVASAPEGEHSPEHIDAAEKIISAVHAKDANALATHIKAFMSHKDEAVDGKSEE